MKKIEETENIAKIAVCFELLAILDTSVLALVAYLSLAFLQLCKSKQQ